MWRADGGYRWYRSFGLPTRDRDGRIIGWYGTTIDIDELKTAEAALRAKRTRAAAIDRHGSCADLVLVAGGQPHILQ